MTRQLGDGLPNRDPRDSEQGPLKKIRQQAEQPQMGQDDRGEQRQQGDEMSMPSNLQAQQQRQGQLHQQMQMSQQRPIDRQQQIEDEERMKMPGMREKLLEIGKLLDEAAQKGGYGAVLDPKDPLKVDMINSDNRLTLGKVVWHEILKELKANFIAHGEEDLRTQSWLLVRNAWSNRFLDPRVNITPVDIVRDTYGQ